jgi:hypothetical protein
MLGNALIKLPLQPYRQLMTGIVWQTHVDLFINFWQFIGSAITGVARNFDCGGGEQKTDKNRGVPRPDGVGSGEGLALAIS